MKKFTPKEATQTLPLVKQIVADILQTGQELQEIVRRLGPEAESESEFRQKNAQLEALMDELEELGCYFKDWNFTIGLVDFPSEIGGREVLLCWRSDEPELAYYHGYHDGYMGRKLIPAGLLE
jgi:hypothetical protein